jgi:iron complex transport system ATP-binding protein
MSILHGLCRQQGITVIASLHDVDMAARVSDQVVLVRDGGVMAWGPPESVLDQEAVARLYDLGAARFSRELGIIEMNSHCRYGPVFVIPGGGSAVGLLRLLYKRGFAMAGGVVHRNDVDYYIGASLGVEMVVEEPFETISEQNHRQARASMEQVETVADAGFPVNKVNRSNLELLRCALRMGTRGFSLRRPEHAAALLGPDADRLCYCPDELALADGLVGEGRTTVGRR